MLTSKQLWRRTKPYIDREKRRSVSTTSSKSSFLEERSSQSANSVCTDGLKESAKVQSKYGAVDVESPDLKHLSMKAEAKTVPLTDGGNTAGFDIKKRNVSFNSLVRVCLVPSRCEYSPITDELYWRHDDYASFKEDAVTELRAYWKHHPSSVKEAITALYQPTYEDVHDSYMMFNHEEKPAHVSVMMADRTDIGSSRVTSNPVGLRSRDSVAKFAENLDSVNEMIGASSCEQQNDTMGIFIDDEEDHTDVEESSVRNNVELENSRKRLDSDSPNSNSKDARYSLQAESSVRCHSPHRGSLDIAKYYRGSMVHTA